MSSQHQEGGAPSSNGPPPGRRARRAATAAGILPGGALRPVLGGQLPSMPGASMSSSPADSRTMGSPTWPWQHQESPGASFAHMPAWRSPQHAQHSHQNGGSVMPPDPHLPPHLPPHLFSR
uniref:Uncharacterized protein n=1 Tax=Dunaliella tertiolecta TaxID=3047 RepID=A0A7S3VM09_DUNTE